MTNVRAERYVEAAIASELETLSSTSSGRNPALNKAAFVLGGFIAAGALGEEDAIERLMQACETNGYARKDGASQVRATIKSGLRKGMQEPRELPSSATKTPQTVRRHQPQTLADFAHARELPIEALRLRGWEDTPRGIAVRYTNRDGTPARTQVRGPRNGRRFDWDIDAPDREIIAYDPDQGALARKLGYLLICEGASDAATASIAGLPVVGVPGESMVRKTVRAHHLEGVSRVYVCVDTNVVGEPDSGGERFRVEVPRHLATLGYSGPVHELRMPPGAKDMSELWVRDRENFVASIQSAMHDAQKPPETAAHALDSAWSTLGEMGYLTKAPPPRRWLLTRPDDETNGACNHGVLQLAKVGLLNAQGGAGKTYSLIELGLAVATGRKWLDIFDTPSPGSVLLALGEEDQEEVWNRFYGVAHAMRLTPGQEAAAGRNIVPLALSGIPVPLVDADGSETDTLHALRRKLAEREWRLVILDPLSRFAGPDTEKDNAAATRFMQAVESLVRAPGSPTVLVAHHTNKISRAEGSKANASNARGSTAITDAARWVAELETLGDEGARFTVVKSNGARLGKPIELVRHDGYLRVATPDEQQRLAQSKSAAVDANTEALKGRICAALRERPGLSKAMLQSVVKASDRVVGRTVDALVLAGVLVKSQDTRHGFELAREEGSVQSP